MKVTGAIFSAPMVLALLDGRKTQTRRLAWIARLDKGTNNQWKRAPSPWQTLKPGDLLYVREQTTRSGGMLQYVADHKTSGHLWPHKWTRDPASPLHLPRAFSRLTLEVVANRVEPVQLISRADAIAEGLQMVSSNIEELFRWPPPFDDALWLSPTGAYQDLWTNLHGASSWDANPEVCAVTFIVHTMNVGRFLASKRVAAVADSFSDGVRKGEIAGFKMDDRECLWPENLAGVEHLGKGALIRFTGFNGGEADQEFAQRLLTVDAFYTMMDTDVRSRSTSIYLKEHPGIGFNSVM